MARLGRTRSHRGVLFCLARLVMCFIALLAGPCGCAVRINSRQVCAQQTRSRRGSARPYITSERTVGVLASQPDEPASQPASRPALLCSRLAGWRSLLARFADAPATLVMSVWLLLHPHHTRAPLGSARPDEPKGAPQRAAAIRGRAEFRRAGSCRAQVASRATEPRLSLRAGLGRL